MKIRVFPGGLNNYVLKGGSWDENKADPLSFEIEVASTPVSGQYIIYEDVANENKLTMALVNEVVFLHGILIYVFVTKGNVVS